MKGLHLSDHFSDTEATYQLLAENTVECIWLFDLKNRRFKYISPSVTSLRGFTVEEAMKEPIEKVLSQKSLKKLMHQEKTRVLDFLAGDRKESTVCRIDEMSIFCKDGSLKTVETSTKLIYLPETDSVDVLGVTRDISKRKHYETQILSELRRKNDQLRMLLGNEARSIKERTQVFCLGSYLIHSRGGNAPVKWRTSKSEELFFFLLHSGGAKVPKYEICESLWPEYDGEKVTNLLHTTLYKMKKTLQNENIQFHIKCCNSAYCFTLEDAFVDFIEFEHLFDLDSIISPASLETCENALRHYQGAYLQGSGYLWSLPKAETFQSKFLQLADGLVRYYIRHQDTSSAIRVLKEVLRHCPYCELAHKSLLRLYFIANDRVSFISHYEAMVDILQNGFGIDPSESLRNMYHAILEK